MEPDAAAALLPAVSDALHRPVAALEDVRRTPLDYDAFLAHRTVTRLRGNAIVGGGRVAWSLIEKRTEGPDLASPYLLDNGRREHAAYASGLLDDLGPGIRTPRLHGRHLESDGAIVLHLEEIHHHGPRPLDAETILSAARDLGDMNGRLIGRETDEPWLFAGWIDRHAQPESFVRGLVTLRRSHPDAVTRLGDRIGRAEQVLLRQSEVRAVLEALPQTICHHDAVGANVFQDGGRTVLIDWESVGPGPVGADLASLLFGSVRRGDALVGTVEPIVDDAVLGYTEGVRASAAHITPDEVRRGFDAAVALRWKLAADVVEALERDEDPRRGSLPDEPPGAAVEELILLIDILLDAADRALA